MSNKITVTNMDFRNDKKSQSFVIMQSNYPLINEVAFRAFEKPHRSPTCIARFNVTLKTNPFTGLNLY